MRSAFSSCFRSLSHDKGCTRSQRIYESDSFEFCLGLLDEIDDTIVYKDVLLILLQTYIMCAKAQAQ